VIRTKLKLILMALITVILFSNLVFAVPGIPNAFYGTVTLNGNPAPDGTVVTAKINGVEVARTTTKNGKYGYSPVFYVDDPNNDLCIGGCPVIHFYVNGIDTGKTAIFCNGCVTEVNLSVNTGGGAGVPGAGGTGGGAGSSTERIIQTNQTGTQQQQCQERWVCSEWSECINGVRTRTCRDENNCGTNNNEPFTSQPCSPEERKEEKTSEGVRITGLFALLSNPVYALAFILGIIAVIAIVLSIIFSRRKK
jgi:hypothetical protein